jgi:hypothetical protein
MTRQHGECLSSILMRRSAQLVMLSLAVTAMTLGLSIGTGHATTIWFDDFSDGDAEDGNPETWSPHPGLPGDYNATSGNYIFTPGEGQGNQDAMAATIEGQDKTFTDVSVRTRTRIGTENAGGNVGPIARFDFAAVSGYFGVVDTNGYFTIVRTDAGGVEGFRLQEQFEDLGAAEDLIVQFDVIGETLSLSAWRPGDPQPEPQLVVETDPTYASGTAGLIFTEDDDRASGVYYWATAATARIINGDVNFDGDVNGLDVDPFVAAVLGGSYDAPADMNGDGAVDGLDVDPFVEAVVGGGTAAVPEPSTLLLCLVALGMVASRRKNLSRVP